MRYVVEKLVRPGKWDLLGSVDNLRLAICWIRDCAEKDGGEYVLRCVEEE